MKIKKVTTNSGTWYDLETPVTITNDNGQKQSTRFYFNGFEPTFKITFGSGDITQTVKSTGNHKFRTSDGSWVRSDQLEVGVQLDNGVTVIAIEDGGVLPTMDMEVPDDHYYQLECGVQSHNTALIMGGVSEGINPDAGLVFTQRSAGGEIDRVNPYLLKIMKDRGVYNKKTVEDVRDRCSVQHVTWLSPDEKEVFKTAFEINQHAILRMASARGKFLDQWQSLNLFFAGDEDEAYIDEVHQEAFLDEDILGLYYVYSNSSVKSSVDRDECTACQ
jgi:hypothetical protein